MEQEISAKPIAHSVYKGDELISIETRSPKFLDAEIEKHRMISSNSSSSRAIPFKKIIEQGPFLPKDVRLNQRGMQGVARLDDVTLVDYYVDIKNHWEETTKFVELYPEVHKQHLNRYLEPFTMQTKIMTATRKEWEYFLGLRFHPDADPNIFQLAGAIHVCLTRLEPRKLQLGEWHLPYILEEERNQYDTDTLLKVSVARCARTSYKLHDGSPTVVDDDVALFNKLIVSNPKHMSPSDHQATPAPSPNVNIHCDSSTWPLGVTRINRDGSWGSGNFDNWIQFRHYYLQGGLSREI